MVAAHSEPAPAPSAASQSTFFRQSGWMMIATVTSGAFMFFVHFFSKKIPEAEYGILGTLLAILNCMAIPGLGLQMVFAQQAASTITDEQHRQLTGTTRAVWLGTTLLWLLMAGAVVIWHQDLLVRLQIANPAALWMTVLVALGLLWMPIFNGLMQGRQNFLWLGWAAIVHGAGRLAGVAVIVLLFGGWAAGILTGALVGVGAIICVAMWHTREVWLGPAAAFEWRGWLARVVPLTLGFGACQFFFSADPIFVQSHFDKEQTGFYVAVGTLSRALVMFTAPLAAVMFPKIVRSAAQKEKSDVLGMTVLATVVLVGLGALGLSVIAPWLIRLVFKSSFVEIAAPLMPWFAWSMVPLAVANVLVNNLLARSNFRVVPWLVVLAVAYGVTLHFVAAAENRSFERVIRTIGAFNLLVLAVAAMFTWAPKFFRAGKRE